MIDVSSSPLSQIAKNAGKVPEVILEKTISNRKGYGYDARADKFSSIVDEGIIDPALLVISELRHASSAAENLLSIGCAMHPTKESPNEDFEDLQE